MKLWNILYDTPDMTEERHVKAPTMAEAMKKVTELDKGWYDDHAVF